MHVRVQNYTHNARLLGWYGGKSVPNPELYGRILIRVIIMPVQWWAAKNKASQSLPLNGEAEGGRTRAPGGEWHSGAAI